MVSRKLDHLELLSISEKDEQYYNHWINEEVHDLAQRFLGVRRWMQLRSAITFVSRFTYFGITSLSNKSTPGEEYCDAEVKRPNLLKNLLMVLLNNEIRLPPEIPKSYANLLQDVHLISFFLFGDFYELAKRLTNYSYLTADSNSYQSKRMGYLYQLIGCMSIVKLAINVTKESTTTKSCSNSMNDRLDLNSKIKTQIDTNSDMICHLCSNQRKEPTSTICGHIFCWNCIHKWLRERSECPICRTPTQPSRLIHLINFR